MLLSEGDALLWPLQALTKHPDGGATWTQQPVALLQGLQKQCSWVDVNLSGGIHFS